MVDGGLLDNLPVGAMRARCAGSVVASDVSVAVDLQMRDAARYRRRRFRIPWRSLRMPGIGSILMRTVQLASVKESRLAGTPADLYLHPPVDDLGMNDFARLEEIVERGQQYALERLAEWPR
jgi:NTE family protein